MAKVKKSNRARSVHPRRSDNHPDHGQVTLQQMSDLFKQQFQSLKGDVAETLLEVRQIMLTYHNIAKSLTTIESNQRAFILYEAKHNPGLKNEFELRQGYGELSQIQGTKSKTQVVK